MYEDIVEGYQKNIKKKSYIGDYTQAQGFERTILQSYYQYLNEDMSLGELIRIYESESSPDVNKEQSLREFGPMTDSEDE